MAASRDTTAEHIKPLATAIVRNYKADATISAGELVAKVATDDREVEAAIATSVILAPVGVALNAAAAGEEVAVVVFGPVLCLTGATVGAAIWATDVAGEPGETAGTKDTYYGFTESDTVLFVRPQIKDFS